MRILKVAEQVALRHDITLLSLCQTQDEIDAPAPDSSVFTSVHRILLPRWRSWMQMAAATMGSTPFQVAYYQCAQFRKEADRLIPAHDLVWCHLVRAAPYASRASIPRWIEMTDAVSLTMNRAASLRARLDPRRWAYSLESKRMARAERAVLNDFDLVSLVSTVDREAILRNKSNAESVLTASNGVSVPTNSGLPAGKRPAAIALLGRMDSVANRDALWHFVKEVLPGILQKEPDTRLRVVGYTLPRDAAQLRRHEAVSVEGPIEDLGSVLRECRVGVCPVRIGAGVQNKVLDYLAHGLATVTSPIGLEGLDAQPGVELTVAQTPGQWVESVTRLLRDDVLATRVGEAGRAMVIRNHQWPVVLAPLMDRVDMLLNPTG